MAFPGQVAAVRPSELYRAPGFRRRQSSVRGKSSSLSTAAPRAGAAVPFLRELRLPRRLRHHAVFSSFLRVLKYGSFYLSIFLPGVFVCLAVYLPELIPPQLLFKIAAAEKATPLPLFAEMLLVIILLEIIREAGLRMPQTLGTR